MSLSDIEEKADDYASRLLSTASRSNADLYGSKLRGLRDLAQIKAVGMEAQAWGTPQPDPRNVSGLCFAISPLAIGKPPYPCCELMRGHDGAHSEGTTNWTNAAEKQDAEPTKPAADRLHELLSYLIQQSEQSLEKSNHVMQESPPWRKHLAASKAYDDAAQKLQEILTEGGI